MLFVPLTMNSSEAQTVDIHLTFNTTQCELVTEYLQCLALPRCYTCIFQLGGRCQSQFHVDFSDELNWLMKPLSTSSRLSSGLFSDTAGFVCVYGSQADVCSAFHSEVEQEVISRQYRWDWSVLSSLTTLILLLLLIVMAVIVWMDACHIRKLKNFYREM